MTQIQNLHVYKKAETYQVGDEAKEVRSTVGKVLGGLFYFQCHKLWQLTAHYSTTSIVVFELDSIFFYKTMFSDLNLVKNED